jgi:hypothetical protein
VNGLSSILLAPSYLGWYGTLVPLYSSPPPHPVAPRQQSKLRAHYVVTKQTVQPKFLPCTAFLGHLPLLRLSVTSYFYSFNEELKKSPYFAIYYQPTLFVGLTKAK